MLDVLTLSLASQLLQGVGLALVFEEAGQGLQRLINPWRIRRSATYAHKVMETSGIGKDIPR